MDSFEQISTLSVPVLLEQCTQLVRQDRECLARLLEVLGEIDRRKVWAQKAYPSMFEFCRQTFNMSESTAAKRMWAARVVRKYPAALPMVRRGELHLTGIHRLARHLTPENHRAVLDRARNKSTREIELLVAEIAPKPDVPARVRKLPSVGTAKNLNAVVPGFGETRGTCTEEAFTPPESIPSDLAANTGRENVSRADVVEGCSSNRSSDLRGQDEAWQDEAWQDKVPQGSVRQDNARHDKVTPLAPERFRLQATIDAETREKIRQLQDLRSHGDGTNRDIASILSDAIELLLTETLRRKAAVPAVSATGFARRAKARSVRVSPIESTDVEEQGQGSDLAPKPLEVGRVEAASATRSCAAGAGRRATNGEARKGQIPATSRASRKPASRSSSEDESRRPSANVTRRIRAIPPALRREVWLRDNGRCTFRADRGRRCAATARLEYHHEVPYAHGGKHQPGNISLRCRAHNQYQADLDFGTAFMNRKHASHAEQPGQGGRSGR